MSQKKWISKSKYLTLGVVLGTAFGIAFDDLSLGICFGILLGTAFFKIS